MNPEFYLNCKIQVSNILIFTYLQMNYVFTILFDFREIKHNLWLVSLILTKLLLNQTLDKHKNIWLYYKLKKLILI